MFQLRDGHIVVSAQPVFQAAQNLALVFQGPRIQYMDFQGKEADRHFRSRNNAVALVKLTPSRNFVRRCDCAARTRRTTRL